MTTYVLCSGPSLSTTDIALVENEHAVGRGRVIVTNRTFQFARFADICFGMDEKWWRCNAGEVRKTGMRMVSSSAYCEKYGIEVVARSPEAGLSPHGVAGKNTGHQAITYAWLTDMDGDIAVLGFDLQHANGKAHHYGDHPAAEDGTIFQNAKCPETWHDSAYRLADDAARLGARIVNCSPYSSRWLGLEHMSVREFINGRGNVNLGRDKNDD